MILRLLNPQGIVGIAASLCLALLLVLQKGETRHWKKQSGQYEQMYRDGEAALAETIANYRAAAEQARAADRARAARVKGEQAAINERISDDFENRIAAARADARRLRREPRTAAADPRARGDAPVSGLSPASRGAADTAGQDRLPRSDALIATEQAIQLGELINWVKQQHEVDANFD